MASVGTMRRTIRYRRADARSFAAYMHDRPAPLDGVERVLCRLDWLLSWRTQARLAA